jgi:Transglycosylase-like domain
VYLRTTSPHAPPPPPTPPASGVWARLAQCESTGDWRAISRGGTYRGGLQFDQQTWADYGGLAYASSAHLATPAQQIAVAERLRAARGFQPWPACSRRLGLR